MANKPCELYVSTTEQDEWVLAECDGCGYYEQGHMFISVEEIVHNHDEYVRNNA